MERVNSRLLRMPKPTTVPISIPRGAATGNRQLDAWVGQVQKTLKQLRDRGRREIPRQAGPVSASHPFKLSTAAAGPTQSNVSVSEGAVYVGRIYDDDRAVPVLAAEMIGMVGATDQAIANSTTLGAWVRCTGGTAAYEPAASPSGDYANSTYEKLEAGAVVFSATRNTAASLEALIGDGGAAESSSYTYIWIGSVERGPAGAITITQDLRSDAYFPVHSWSDLDIVGNNNTTVTLANGTWEVDS